MNAVPYIDLVSPIYRFVRGLIEGPSFTFRVQEETGWNIFAIKSTLKRAGCSPIWGLEIFDGEMRMTVKAEHAQRGYWALHRAGVPMYNDVPKTRKTSR